MANILIIDDNISMCVLLGQIIKEMGHKSFCAHTIKQGLKTISASAFDVVYLDVVLPDGNGLEFIPKVMAIPSSPEVVIITGKGERKGAEMAIKNGAWDYINKPFRIDEITLQLTGILKYRQEKKSFKKPVLLKKEGIIGESREFNDCLNLLIEAAESDANALITGETGAGKELFARAIHLNSSRAKNSFVVVDCGALTETLIGSTLFGHEKGAFTGADNRHVGLIKQADKGTLFLDEVGELPISIQKAFLRALQEHKVRPLGRNSEIESDFRLISATNRNLEQLVSEEKLRKDLLYRLQTITIDLPPLRQRKSDIKALTVYYINKFCDYYGYESKGFSKEFIEMMISYDWPGNVRELANAVEKAVCSARDEETLHAIHLPPAIRIRLVQEEINKQNNDKLSDNSELLQSGRYSDLKTFLQENERQYLEVLISATNGDIKEICRISGLSRSRLYARLKSYKLKPKS